MPAIMPDEWSRLRSHACHERGWSAARESDDWMNDGNGRAGLRVSAIRARAFARATLPGGGSEGAPEGGARRSEAPFDELTSSTNAPPPRRSEERRVGKECISG